MSNVEMGIVQPLGRTDVEHVRAQLLGTSRNAARPLGDGPRQKPEFGDRALDDGKTSHCQAYVRVRILGLEEASVKRGEVLHAVTMRAMPATPAGSQVLELRAQ